MSASQYNSPYGVYKREQQLPRIHYPPMFDCCTNGKISFKHVLDSKFLAIAALLFLIGFLITLICIISPFWFKLVFSPQDGTFGGEATKYGLSINCGIFFLNENEFDNLMSMDKRNNQQSVPGVLLEAQILEMMGVCGLFACSVAAIILVLRKLAAVTAYFLLAFFSTISGVLLGIVFLQILAMSFYSNCDPYDVGDDCIYTNNLQWRAFPIYSQRFRVEPLVTPHIKLNWTTYIALFCPVLVLVGSALVWLEAFSTYKEIVKIRYQQLITPRDPYENDIDPKKHGHYVYSAPVQQGAMSYGMQPVARQEGPYQHQQQPNVGFNVGFQQPSRGVGFDDYETKRSSPPARKRSPPPMRRRSPSPDDDSPGSSRRYSPPPYNGRKSPSAPRRRSPSPPRRGGPPSLNSSMSEGGPYISREIDL